MGSFAQAFGHQDPTELAYSAAERASLREIPPESLQTAGTDVIGKISPSTKRLVLNHLAFGRLTQEKHDEARKAGGEAHREMHLIIDNVCQPILSAMEMMIHAHLVADLGDELGASVKKYAGLRIGEGDTIVGIPEPERNTLAGLGFDLVIVGAGRSMF